ncbi:GNAT family N-acetyltransferase [Pseudalkalibacillus caeni]|uniref:GNAT family N-acetyltransferase n=1 Tax=Exobacillus caeni TaxID=2574798 RepID=A0A5R9F4M6_9BACL|nr:GNAT family N-acetyltransferase [Pseudalkalibacillus caeni]TLS37981.1 GNAT family N-acetyltransferase [Pseudalkalibacillus caeni]
MFVKRVRSERELHDAYKVRTEVFVEEQKVPPEEEIDQFEDQCIHFVAYDEGEPVGAGRLRTVESTGKVERICVAKSHRGTGLGKQIMKHIEKEAHEQDFSILKLNAQTHAEEFYRKLGYETDSGEFLDAGIPHVAMKKRLNTETAV